MQAIKLFGLVLGFGIWILMSILSEEHMSNKAEVRQADSVTGGKLMGAVAVLRESQFYTLVVWNMPPVCICLSFMIPLGSLFVK